MELTDKDFEFFLNRLSDITKFNFTNYSKPFILRRINGRLRRLDLETFEQYLDYTKKNPMEQQTLIKDFSIPVTHFFRDKAMYDDFMLESMFNMLKLKDTANNRKLKVWSAGCCTGEEPYSIAIILLELLGNRAPEFKIQIIASDLDRDALTVAKAGIYAEEKFSETDPSILDKYFTKSDKIYEITDNIKSLVSFQVSNILTDAKPTLLDVIFCRNVVIYFNEEVKEKLFDEFWKCLNNHGFLILGKTETLIGPAREKFRLNNISERIYTKEI